jgi:hypothetical protein
MDSIIAKIYELLYSPIVTPYNLLENAKLANYKYVNYYKGDLGLIAEMQCVMDDNEEVVFYYHFDEYDKLMKVYKEENQEKVVVFDREEEFEGVKKTYSIKMKDSINVQVV